MSKCKETRPIENATPIKYATTKYSSKLHGCANLDGVKGLYNGRPGCVFVSDDFDIKNAYKFGSLCVPHTWCHVIGLAAELHLAAIVPNMPYFEFPLAFPKTPLVTDLLIPKINILENGNIEVPNRPGLGFDLNEDVIKEYGVDPY